jgi:hypothetical protein
VAGAISWRWFRTERPPFLVTLGRKGLATGKFLGTPAGGPSARRAVRPRGRNDFLALGSHRAADFFGDIREEDLGRREILARSGRRSKCEASGSPSGRERFLGVGFAQRGRLFWLHQGGRAWPRENFHALEALILARGDAIGLTLRPERFLAVSFAQAWWLFWRHQGGRAWPPGNSYALRTVILAQGEASGSPPRQERFLGAGSAQRGRLFWQHQGGRAWQPGNSCALRPAV